MAELREQIETWRPGDNSLNASPDHQGELDEIFMNTTHVHIERMNDTGFWIGIDLADGERVNLNTGIAEGSWFFNVEHDAENGSNYSVQREASERLREVQLLLARLSREKVDAHDSLGFFHARSVLLTRARELRAAKGTAERSK